MAVNCVDSSTLQRTPRWAGLGDQGGEAKRLGIKAVVRSPHSPFRQFHPVEPSVFPLVGVRQGKLGEDERAGPHGSRRPDRGRGEGGESPNLPAAQLDHDFAAHVAAAVGRAQHEGAGLDLERVRFRPNPPSPKAARPQDEKAITPREAASTSNRNFTLGFHGRSPLWGTIILRESCSRASRIVPDTASRSRAGASGAGTPPPTGKCPLFPEADHAVPAVAGVHFSALRFAIFPVLELACEKNVRSLGPSLSAYGGDSRCRANGFGR